MKCARCDHQWQLVPETADLDVLEPVDKDDRDQQSTAEQSVMPDAPRAQSLDEPTPASAWQDEATFNNAFPSNERDDDPAISVTDWRSRREQYAATISTLSEPRSFDDTTRDKPPYPSDSDYDAGETWGDRDRNRPGIGYPEDADGEKEDYAAGLSFLNRERFSPEAEEQNYDDPAPASKKQRGGGWAQRWLRPWRPRSAPARLPVEAEAETARQSTGKREDAEIAIREALKYALEHPGESADTERDFESYPAGRYARNQDDGLRSARAAYSKDEYDQEASLTFDPEVEREIRSTFDKDELAYTASFQEFETRKSSHDKEPEEDAEPPFRLTGKSARAPIFGSGGGYNDEIYDEEERLGERDRYKDVAEDPLASYVSKESVERESFAGFREDYAEQPNDFTSLYDQKFEHNQDNADSPPLDADGFSSFEDDPETTDLTKYSRPHSQGSLAIAAAWAVFISVISGVLLALVSFRQDIMVALPGTSQLYKALGFEVAASGIDFADVSYRWTTQDGKPMIQVTGQVINTTDRAVKVPRVLVNVRDAGGLEGVTATASVPKDELAPRETADFVFEVLSQPEDVAQIELEFDQQQ